MFIEEIKPNGFCGGVKRAIRIVNDGYNNFPKPIYMLGYLIHNKHVIKDFEEKGIIVLDKDLDNEINNIEKGTVIITAHGISPKLRERLINKNLYIVDTTCTNVLKIHEIVSKKVNDGFNVYIIGNKNHPEVKGILGISDKVQIYDENNNDLNSKTFICNQTTLNYNKLNETFNKIKKVYKNVEINNEVCSATRARQEGIIENYHKYDLIVIVGDKLSNNCNSLYELAKSLGVDAIKVEYADELNNFNLSKYHSVGITSGASTPREIFELVYNKIKNIK